MLAVLAQDSSSERLAMPFNTFEALSYEHACDGFADTSARDRSQHAGGSPTMTGRTLLPYHLWYAKAFARRSTLLARLANADLEELLPDKSRLTDRCARCQSELSLNIVAAQPSPAALCQQRTSFTVPQIASYRIGKAVSCLAISGEKEELQRYNPLGRQE